MNLNLLKEKIENHIARIAVIGMGYVGFPLALTLADVGFDVVGVDVKEERVRSINKSENPIGGVEPDLQDLLDRTVQAGTFHATIDYEDIKDREIVFINVETPIDEYNKPNYTALRSALRSLGKVLLDGALVIIESTIAPGTMQKVVLPELMKSSKGTLNKNFYLGNCPERVMPGKLLKNIRTMDRVVGGADEETSHTMALLYQQFVDAELDEVDWITAELVKTVENTYRDVQIAFANEVALLCEELGADVWRVRELVNKTPFRDLHKPGAGVGGHCIPKDPWLLANSVSNKKELRLIPTARVINDAMPRHMFDMLKVGLQRAGQELSTAKILILGYAYLENSDDDRNSPTADLVEIMEDNSINYRIHDPHIDVYKGDVYQMVDGCDALVVMTAHQEYVRLDLEMVLQAMRTKVIIDGRAVFKDRVISSDLLYYTIGIGA